MLVMMAEETTADATREIRNRVAMQISGALFAIDPLGLGDGKAGWTYDDCGRILACDVRTGSDLRAYLDGWDMMQAYPILSHLLGTY